jgi:hypothetical protein
VGMGLAARRFPPQGQGPACCGFGGSEELVFSDLDDDQSPCSPSNPCRWPSPRALSPAPWSVSNATGFSSLSCHVHMHGLHRRITPQRRLQ